MSTTVQCLTCEEAKKLLDNGEALLIDVRGPDEYVYEHIPGSLHIPLEQAVTVLPAFETSKPIILQCQTGNRSTKAAQLLCEQNQFHQLSSMSGGIDAWRSSGFATTKGCKALPVMRQVQIAAGSLVFGGVLLALMLAKIFWVIPAFVGAGLVFAGITGSCGLAILLSAMPWNRPTSFQGKTCSTRKEVGKASCC